MIHPNGMCAVVECLNDEGRWQTLQEHGAVQPDPYTYTSYVESYLGRQFRIRYLPPANSYNSGYDFAISVCVDGRHIEGTLFARHNMSGKWSGRNASRTDAHPAIHFWQDDDDLATSNESIVKAMGSIVVRVDRVQSAHREQAVYDSRKPVNAQLHERTKKIDMDHSTVFGDPKITPAVMQSVIVHHLDPAPIFTAEFKYRSGDLLVAEGIKRPMSGSASAPTLGQNHSTATVTSGSSSPTPGPYLAALSAQTRGLAAMGPGLVAGPAASSAAPAFNPPLAPAGPDSLVPRSTPMSARGPAVSSPSWRSSSSAPSSSELGSSGGSSGSKRKAPAAFEQGRPTGYAPPPPRQQALRPIASEGARLAVPPRPLAPPERRAAPYMAICARQKAQKAAAAAAGVVPQAKAPAPVKRAAPIKSRAPELKAQPKVKAEVDEGFEETELQRLRRENEALRAQMARANVRVKAEAA